MIEYSDSANTSKVLLTVMNPLKLVTLVSNPLTTDWSLASLNLPFSRRGVIMAGVPTSFPWYFGSAVGNEKKVNALSAPPRLPGFSPPSLCHFLIIILSRMPSQTLSGSHIWKQTNPLGCGQTWQLVYPVSQISYTGKFKLSESGYDWTQLDWRTGLTNCQVWPQPTN